MDRSAKEGGFVRLYAQYQNNLFRYVSALVPHLQDAEDVLGDVAVALWEEFDTFQPGTNFAAWAKQIAYFRVLKYYRARDQRVALPERLLEKLAIDFSRRETTVDQRLGYLNECKANLASQDAQLLERRYVKRQTVRDIAGQFAKTENAISKALARIRQTLLACIERKIARESQRKYDSDGNQRGAT